MGMIQTIIKVAKVDADKSAFLGRLQSQVKDLVANGDGDGDRPEGGEAFNVTESKFDDVFNDQEQVEPSAENRDHYYQVCKEGRLFAVVIDW